MALIQKLDNINWSLIFERPKMVEREERRGEEEEEEEEEEKEEKKKRSQAKRYGFL